MQQASSIRAVLLDIDVFGGFAEGTVCSISFVHDVLFPYALHVLPKYLSDNWDTDEFRPFRDAFPQGVRDSQESLEAYVRDLSARDLKVPCLKQLQGILWRTGYATGEIKAPIYADVLPAIQRWLDDSKSVMIYSSGSVAAQKLLFAHTDCGDMTPLLSGYFDTVNAGSKQDPASYSSIAKQTGIDAQSWLFCSDNVKEIEAAKMAGMDAVLVVRPGNAPLTAEDRETHRAVESFSDLFQ